MDMAQAQRGRGRPRNDPGQPWSGRSLRLRRLDAGLTLAQLGDHVGVSGQTISEWEGGTPPASKRIIALLAQKLGCEPRDLGRDPRL
jgi:transcriptional regulator with XRE-family HTH domain